MDLTKRWCTIVIIVITIAGELTGQDLFFARQGDIFFRSNAPLEVISAESMELKGVINPSTRAFAFTVNVNTFKGFNSVIQRTHFLESYIEAEKFPSATFTGKIIERVDFDEQGTTQVRVKGLLDIHGVDLERIITGTLTRDGDVIRVQATFSIVLAEYDITIPKVVHQKVADTIYVHVDIQMKRID